MKFPYIETIPEGREMTTVFAGYNHTDMCQEGQFFDMENMGLDRYPILTSRKKTKVYPRKLYGADKGSFTFVMDMPGSRNLQLMVDGVNPFPLTQVSDKQIVRMGGIVAIFPDNIWINPLTGQGGSMGNSYKMTSGGMEFSLVDKDGTALTTHNSKYYEDLAKKEPPEYPNDGDYLLDKKNGKSSLKVYSATTKMWNNVPTTYFKVKVNPSTSTNVISGFKEGDGVKISIKKPSSWDYATNIFVNNETKSGVDYIYSYFVIQKIISDTEFIIPGLLDQNKTFTSTPIYIDREVPEMAYVTECQNRIWGCSADGHEVYACKLGDVTNWKTFAGISTDSYAATIGSQGEFTGAITYLGYPLFFKENSVTRVTVSSTGAHQLKDINLRGVQKGCSESLVMVDELLYYKSRSGVCAYDGQFPTVVSEQLGAVTYSEAAGGTINGKYYICMKDDSTGIKWLFTYDTKKRLWNKERKLDATHFLLNQNGTVLFAGQSAKEGVTCVAGNPPDTFVGNIAGNDEMVGLVPWMIESGPIGYDLPDKKQLSKINVRMRVAVDAYVSFQIQYDSAGPYETVWQIYGRGTKTFTIPVKPRRCDHYRYRIVGHGDVDIISLTKSFTEGSDR